MEAVKDEFEFVINWKPFLLNPNVPEEGMPFEELLKGKYGAQSAEAFLSGRSPYMQAGTKVVSKVASPASMVMTSLSNEGLGNC